MMLDQAAQFQLLESNLVVYVCKVFQPETADSQQLGVGIHVAEGGKGVQKSLGGSDGD